MAVHQVQSANSLIHVLIQTKFNVSMTSNIDETVPAIRVDRERRRQYVGIDKIRDHYRLPSRLI